MRKWVLVLGLLGLLTGLFVYEYFIGGVPVISFVSLMVLLFGLLTGKRREKQLTKVEGPQQLHCGSCGSQISQSQRFCPNCGAANPYKLDNPQYHAPSITQPINVQTSISEGSKVSTIGNLGKAFMNLFSGREPLLQVSEAVYEKLDPVGLLDSMKLFLVSAALFIGFYLLLLGNQAYSIINSNLMYFLATYSVALIYFLVIYRTDKYEREPFKFILFIFAWGVFCGILAAPLNSLIGPLFQASLGSAALAAPFTEEPLKALGFYYLVTRRRFMDEFNTPLDGIVYGFAAGMGFFAMENFLYFLSVETGGEALLLMRSLLLWGHGVWVATTGLWLAIAKIQRGYLWGIDLIPGMMVAIVLHFLWNGWQGFLGVEIGWGVMIVQLIFQFWYMRKIIKEALRDEVLWGYGRGMAPVE
jgi:RsiW-degrading membrane proteinase PrsW (M82 family)